MYLSAPFIGIGIIIVTAAFSLFISQESANALDAASLSSTGKTDFMLQAMKLDASGVMSFLVLQQTLDEEAPFADTECMLGKNAESPGQKSMMDSRLEDIEGDFNSFYDSLYSYISSQISSKTARQLRELQEEVLTNVRDIPDNRHGYTLATYAVKHSIEEFSAVFEKIIYVVENPVFKLHRNRVLINEVRSAISASNSRLNYIIAELKRTGTVSCGDKKPLKQRFEDELSSAIKDLFAIYAGAYSREGLECNLETSNVLSRTRVYPQFYGEGGEYIVSPDERMTLLVTVSEYGMGCMTPEGNTKVELGSGQYVLDAGLLCFYSESSCP